jgi:hypothetical protein
VTHAIPIGRRFTVDGTRADVLRALGPAAVAAALALLAVMLRWKGSDLPAHFFRVGLVERDGVEVWNNFWFGGHHTLGYGIMFPLLGATIGIWTVALLSAATSAALVDLLIVAGTGRRHVAASMWFAVGTVTNVAVGRLPFALGMTIGLGAVLAARHRMVVLALVLTVLTSTASPVVSVFLAIVFAAWFVVAPGERRTWGALTIASVVPVLVVAALYPQGGTFPFRWQALTITLVACGVVAALVAPTYRLVRVAAGLYAVASVLAFFVPTPLGANITRLGMYATGPILLALASQHRRALAVLLPFAAFWMWSPAIDAIARAPRDPSVEASYYEPLVEWFESNDTEVARVEVVPTSRHWETAYVAIDIPIARGWERQLDMRFNPEFYEPELPVGRYLRWLLDEGVEYVALADAVPDLSGRAEAEILAGDPPFLREVWSNDHWRVWEVLGSTGYVDGPADLVELGIDDVVLDVREQGDVVVRVRSSAFWVSDPPVCIEPTDDGWIVLRDVPPGQVRVYLDEADLVEVDDPCATK